MNRDEQEMALWREAYILALSQTWDYAKAEEAGCAAIEAFRKRYPVEPAAPPAVWYDEPPFKKDGGMYYCWVEGSTVPQSIYWSGGGSGAWLHFCDRTPVHPLNGRRVSPITKPQEPTQ